METEPTTTPVTVITPKRHWGGWLIGLLLILGLLGGLYWYTVNQNKATDNIDTTQDDALAETGDPVADQLSSVSDRSDPDTLTQELADTDLEDITAELDNIAVETEGL